VSMAYAINDARQVVGVIETSLTAIATPQSTQAVSSERGVAKAAAPGSLSCPPVSRWRLMGRSMARTRQQPYPVL
jgi:hypothetical protein